MLGSSDRRHKRPRSESSERPRAKRSERPQTRRMKRFDQLIKSAGYKNIPELLAVVDQHGRKDRKGSEIILGQSQLYKMRSGATESPPDELVRSLASALSLVKRTRGFREFTDDDVVRYLELPPSRKRSPVSKAKLDSVSRKALLFVESILSELQAIGVIVDVQVQLRKYQREFNKFYDSKSLKHQDEVFGRIANVIVHDETLSIQVREAVKRAELMRDPAVQVVRQEAKSTDEKTRDLKHALSLLGLKGTEDAVTPPRLAGLLDELGTNLRTDHRLFSLSSWANSVMGGLITVETLSDLADESIPLWIAFRCAVTRDIGVTILQQDDPEGFSKVLETCMGDGSCSFALADRMEDQETGATQGHAARGREWLLRIPGHERDAFVAGYHHAPSCATAVDASETRLIEAIHFGDVTASLLVYGRLPISQMPVEREPICRIVLALIGSHLHGIATRARDHGARRALEGVTAETHGPVGRHIASARENPNQGQYKSLATLVEQITEMPSLVDADILELRKCVGEDGMARLSELASVILGDLIKRSTAATSVLGEIMAWVWPDWPEILRLSLMMHDDPEHFSFEGRSFRSWLDRNGDRAATELRTVFMEVLSQGRAQSSSKQ